MSYPGADTGHLCPSTSSVSYCFTFLFPVLNCDIDVPKYFTLLHNLSTNVNLSLKFIIWVQCLAV